MPPFLFLLRKSLRLMEPVSQGPCIKTQCIWIMLSWWLSCKESVCQCKKCIRRCVFDSWVGKIPWMRAWQTTSLFLPRKYTWAENPIARGSSSIESHRDGHTQCTHTPVNLYAWETLAHLNNSLNDQNYHFKYHFQLNTHTDTHTQAHVGGGGRLPENHSKQCYPCSCMNAKWLRSCPTLCDL